MYNYLMQAVECIIVTVCIIISCRLWKDNISRPPDRTSQDRLILCEYTPV